MNEQKQSKLIFSAGVARHLLKMGCTMIDIKPSITHLSLHLFRLQSAEQCQLSRKSDG